MHNETIQALLKIETDIRALPDANHEEIKAAQSASQAAASLAEALAKREVQAKAQAAAQA